jgi:hypothetical protein
MGSLSDGLTERCGNFSDLTHRTITDLTVLLMHENSVRYTLRDAPGASFQLQIFVCVLKMQCVHKTKTV